MVGKRVSASRLFRVPLGGRSRTNPKRVNGPNSPRPGMLYVRAATTANGTLATAFANSSVVDGVTLATGDQILLKNQTTQTENGVYTVNAAGAPTRVSNRIERTLVQVASGTANAGTRWMANESNIVLGTTAITFSAK